MLKTNQIRKKKERKEKKPHNNKDREQTYYSNYTRKKNTTHQTFLTYQYQKIAKSFFFPLKNEVACNDNMKPCTMLVRFL